MPGRGKPDAEMRDEGGTGLLVNKSAVFPNPVFGFQFSVATRVVTARAYSQIQPGYAIPRAHFPADPEGARDGSQARRRACEPSCRGYGRITNYQRANVSPTAPGMCAERIKHSPACRAQRIRHSPVCRLLRSLGPVPFSLTRESRRSARHTRACRRVGAEPGQPPALA